MAGWLGRLGGLALSIGLRRGVGRPDLIEVPRLLQKLRILKQLPLIVPNLRRGKQLLGSAVEPHHLATIRGIETHFQRLVRNNEHSVVRARSRRLEYHESRLAGLGVEHHVLDRAQLLALRIEDRRAHQRYVLDDPSCRDLPRRLVLTRLRFRRGCRERSTEK